MKGTKVLCIKENFNQRKAFLLDYIHTCQDLIKAIQQSSLHNSTLAREVIKEERILIRDTWAELKQLQRWFKTAGLEPDEPYYPESYKRWEASLTEEEWEARLMKAHELDRLLYDYNLEMDWRKQYE